MAVEAEEVKHARDIEESGDGIVHDPRAHEDEDDLTDGDDE